MATGVEPHNPLVSQQTRHRAYTSWIERTSQNDPGARTALRSGLRRGIDDVPRMHRLVAPWLPREGVSDAEQRAYYAVASMIAAQPRSRYAGTDDPDADAAADGTPGPSAATAGAPLGSVADAVPVPTSAQRAARFGVSLGSSFAIAVAERDMRESTADSRLNLLTRQSVNGLHRHLPASVGYLRDLDVPVDWAQLLDDLIAWPVLSGRISRRWLQDYYRLRAKAEHTKAAEADRQETAQVGPHV